MTHMNAQLDVGRYLLRGLCVLHHHSHQVDLRVARPQADCWRHEDCKAASTRWRESGSEWNQNGTMIAVAVKGRGNAVTKVEERPRKGSEKAQSGQYKVNSTTELEGHCVHHLIRMKSGLRSRTKQSQLHYRVGRALCPPPRASSPTRAVRSVCSSSPSRRTSAPCNLLK